MKKTQKKIYSYRRKRNSKKLAQELVKELRLKGINADMQTGKFVDGTTKYHVRIDGKEFVNIGTSKNYFTKTQAGPILNWYEFEKLGAFKRDAYGIKLGNIRDQMRIKLWKGFVERARPKDIIDAKGIKKGTDKLVKGKKAVIPPKEVFTKKEIERFYKSAEPSRIREQKAYEYYRQAYKKPTYAKYKRGYKKPAYTSYTPYTPYSTYIPSAPYTATAPYSQTTPYSPYAPYTPYTITEPIPETSYFNIPQRKAAKTSQARYAKRDKVIKATAFIPLFKMGSGKEIKGDKFFSLKGAISEGLIGVEGSNANSFTIIKEEVPTNQIKIGRSANKLVSRFTRKGNRFVRKNKIIKKNTQGTQGSINLMPYVY